MGYGELGENTEFMSRYSSSEIWKKIFGTIFSIDVIQCQYKRFKEEK